MTALTSLARRMPRPRLLPIAILVAALLAVIAAPVRAEDPPADAAVTVEELESLAATLEDEAARTRLLADIRALAEATRGAAEPGSPSLGESAVAALAAGARETSGQLVALAEAMRDLPQALAWLADRLSDPDSRRFSLLLALKLLVVLGVGWLAEALARRALAAPRASLESREAGSLVVRVPFLAARTVLDLVPVAVFVGAAYAALSTMQTVPEARLVAVAFVSAYLIARGATAAVRVVLVPAAPSLRLLPLEDETANYLYVWARRFVSTAAFGFYATEAAVVLGMPASGQVGLLRLLGVVVAAMAVVFVLQNRAGVGAWLRGPRTAGAAGLLRRRLADIWHVLAILYVGAALVVWLLQIEDGFGFLARATGASALILIVAGLVTGGVRRLVEHGFRVSDEIKAKYPTLERRANRYLPVMQTLLQGLIAVVAALALIQAWGGDVVGWLAGPAGGRFLGGLVSVVVVVAGAVLVWEGTSSAIERYLSETDADGNLVERSARARTLLPLLRNALFVVLTVMVVLIVLSEVGVNIAPLLAGAGVVGLAIGFGSQKLVQDVITGAFILFEDAIAVGDVVNVAGIGGLVEAISIRSIRLRDLSGNVHTVPFSSVDTVTNMTKDFSYYLLDIGVAYREDTDEVARVAQELVDEMREEPAYAREILEPLEVLGVDKFGDSAVVLKARIKTRPIKQWMVGREFNRRMKKRFDELGIEIPFPHRTLYFGELKDGTAPAAPVRMEASKPPPKRRPAEPDAPPPEPPSDLDLPDTEGE